MGDDRFAYDAYEAWERGRQKGMAHLFSAFVVASSLSYGLTPDELDELSEYCSFLAHCFRILSQTERCDGK